MDSGYFSRDARHDYFIYSSPMASFNYSVWKGLHWSVLAAVPSPSGLALSADGSTLYVGSRSGGSVYAFLAASGLLLQTTSPVGSMGLGPTGLALSEAGELLFVAGGDQFGRVHVTEPCLVDSLHDSSCTDGLVDGEETDVDCGGRVCRRCGLGASCAIDADCSSGSCEGGACAASVSAPAPTGLQGYLSSETYAQSFMHHMAHGDMGGASYLNPYPLMEPHFCDTVGTLNQSGIGPINCSRIDFDALLLGGCWCHQCLPENPCGNGGLCVNYNKQGYECDCAGTGYGGDHCTTRRPPSPPPPPPSPLSPPPSPPSPPLPPPPPAFPSKGVLILDGNSNTQACVHDATATRHLNVAIAAQCCDGSTCKRKSSSSDDDCIAGMWSSSFEYTTWQEASSRCAALGYTLCDKNCADKGCNYNSIWVWTSEPCPPAPAPAAPPFPAQGVLILDGNSNTQACVHDATATRHLNVAIAAQCCDGSTCKRKSSSSDDDCIAGMWSSSFEYTTWQEASSRCAALGYTLCDKNCVNAGCNYNSIWVWTSEPCPLPYELP